MGGIYSEMLLSPFIQNTPVILLIFPLSCYFIIVQITVQCVTFVFEMFNRTWRLTIQVSSVKRELYYLWNQLHVSPTKQQQKYLADLLNTEVVYWLKNKTCMLNSLWKQRRRHTLRFKNVNITRMKNYDYKRLQLIYYTAWNLMQHKVTPCSIADSPSIWRQMDMRVYTRVLSRNRH
jgi:hypothetical protein